MTATKTAASDEAKTTPKDAIALAHTTATEREMS